MTLLDPGPKNQSHCCTAEAGEAARGRRVSIEVPLTCYSPFCVGHPYSNTGWKPVSQSLKFHPVGSRSTQQRMWSAHLNELVFDRVHNDSLHLPKVHEGHQRLEAVDLHDGVDLAQLLQQPQYSHLHSKDGANRIMTHHIGARLLP